MALFITACKTDKKTSGINLTNLDSTAVAGNDFYQYACGGWMINNPLTDEYSRFGSFEKLGEESRNQIKEVIEKIASQSVVIGSVEQKIADIYNLAMDSTRRNAEGYAPAQTLLDQIATLKSSEQIVAILPKLILTGVSPYFDIFVDADAEDSKQNILQTYQGGLGIQRDFFVDSDEHSVNIRTKYREHIEKMFQLFGFQNDAKAKADAVFAIEAQLAAAHFSKELLRDPHANYHKMSVESLKILVPQIDWEFIFESLKLDIQELNVSQVEPLAAAGTIIATETIENQIAYLQWNVIHNAAGALSDDIYAENFDFYGKIMSGRKEVQPRWKRAVNAVNGTLGEAVGQLYVKQYFPPEAKERMIKLVDNLKITLGERIEALDWMSNETKARAIEKLGTFYVKIGYPDKWRDYSALEINAEQSYFENLTRAGEFEMQYNLAKAGKPVDKDEWLMTPQTVNAYYNPATNEICFPAAILQYPFFDMQADDAFNYGAIGVVIGHEMTHGFDDQGRQYDKDGNLIDWWTEEDGKRFDERAKVLADYFSSIQVAPNVYGNGQFTLGENIADFGGLKIAFQSLQKAMKTNPLTTVDGFTPEQRFFLAYATVWAANIRPEEILQRTKSDPHSLGKWRVNGQMPHNADWYKAFNISEKDAMYLAPEKRASIW
ncbi:MAG: M13 family metallopeptidase [Paludibacter sp.]|nr:M13 family metallopeptidase [Paludibacter sp.]